MFSLFICDDLLTQLMGISLNGHVFKLKSLTSADELLIATMTGYIRNIM